MPSVRDVLKSPSEPMLDICCLRKVEGDYTGQENPILTQETGHDQRSECVCNQDDTGYREVSMEIAV